MKTFEYFLKQELKRNGHNVSAGMDYLDIVSDEIESAAVRFSNQNTQELEAKILQYRMKYIPDHPNRREFDEHFGISTDRQGLINKT